MKFNVYKVCKRFKCINVALKYLTFLHAHKNKTSISKLNFNIITKRNLRIKPIINMTKHNKTKQTKENQIV
jgi:hypothetical protein